MCFGTFGASSITPKSATEEHPANAKESNASVMNGLEFFIFTSQTTNSRKSCACCVLSTQRSQTPSVFYSGVPRIPLYVRRHLFVNGHARHKPTSVRSSQRARIHTCDKTLWLDRLQRA